MLCKRRDEGDVFVAAEGDEATAKAAKMIAADKMNKLLEQEWLKAVRQDSDEVAERAVPSSHADLGLEDDVDWAADDEDLILHE